MSNRQCNLTLDLEADSCKRYNISFDLEAMQTRQLIDIGMNGPKYQPNKSNNISTHAKSPLQVLLQNRPTDRKDHTADNKEAKSEKPDTLQHPAFYKMNAPSDASTLLGANHQLLFPLLRRSEESDCSLVVGVLRMMEQVSHQMFTYRRDEIAGLVQVFISLRLWWYIWNFPDVHEVLNVKLEL